MSRYTSCAQIGIYHVQTPIIAEKPKVFGSKLSSARILKSNSNSSIKTNLILIPYSWVMMCVKQISKTQHPELDFLFPFTADKTHKDVHSVHRESVSATKASFRNDKEIKKDKH